MKIILAFLFLFGVLPVSFACIPRLRDTKKCEKRTGNFPKPGSLCRSYYLCKNWKLKEVTCPENQHFFPAKGYCVRPEEYPCTEKPISEKCLLPNGKFVKSGTGCKKYFDCCKGVPTEKKCVGRLLFDHARGKCDWPELVYCPEDVRSTGKPSSSAMTTVSGVNSSEEGNSSEEDGSSEKDGKSSKDLKDKSTSPSLFISSSSIHEKVSTDARFTSSAFTKGTYLTTFSSIGESSALPTALSTVESSESPTALSTVESSELPTPLSTVESSELPTALSTVESSELPTALSTMESSEMPITAFSIKGYSESPTASSIIDSSKLPTTASNIAESSELPTTASSIEESSKLPTTSSIVTEEDHVKENTFSTGKDEEISEPKIIDIASTTIISETTVNIFCPEPDGYFPHPNDKHKFIACVAGDIIIMDCPSNLVYVHKKKTCDYE